jgi:hypothetical protein
MQMKRSAVVVMACVFFGGCVTENSEATQTSQLEALIVSNHAQIEVVTMPVTAGSCAKNLVDVYSDGGFIMPMSAMSCVGFLNSYYSEYPHIYNNPVMQKIVRSADQRCNYSKAIDYSAPDPNSEAGQYRIGSLVYLNNYDFIFNAMRANDPSSSVFFRYALNNHKDVCLEMINEARATYFQ